MIEKKGKEGKRERDKNLSLSSPVPPSGSFPFRLSDKRPGSMSLNFVCLLLYVSSVERRGSPFFREESLGSEKRRS